MQHIKSVRITPTLSFWLDVVRGLAAMVVLVGHARAQLFGSYFRGFGGVPDVVAKVFFVLFGMGTQAVICFFVMSGVLIAPRFLDPARYTPRYLRDYAIARVVRLWVVAIPALVLSAIVANLAMWYFGASTWALGNQCAPEAKDLLVNLAFLHKAFFPTICSNAAYWSIHNEFFYYMLWPALAIALMGGHSRLRLASVVFLIVVVGALAANDPLDYHSTLVLFPVWLCGGLCLAMPRPRGSAWLWGTLSLVAVIVPNLLPWKGTWFLEDMAIAVTLSFFFRSVRDVEEHPPQWLVSLAKWAANISFSLYLTHVIFLNLLRTYLEYGLGISMPFRGFTPLSVSVYVGLVGFVVAFGHLFYLVFEKRTDAIRDFCMAPLRARDERRAVAVSN